MAKRTIKLDSAELEELLISLGSVGTATFAIILKMLRAFVSKGLLTRIEVIAILDAAAESAEKTPDRLGGRYSKSTGATIRRIMDQFLDKLESDSKH